MSNCSSDRDVTLINILSSASRQQPLHFPITSQMKVRVICYLWQIDFCLVSDPGVYNEEIRWGGGGRETNKCPDFSACLLMCLIISRRFTGRFALRCCSIMSTRATERIDKQSPNAYLRYPETNKHFALVFFVCASVTLGFHESLF